MQEQRNVTRRRVLIAALTALLLLSVATCAGFTAARAKPGIQFQISPANQLVARGQTATYTVTLTSTGGFARTVDLSASGLPSGSTFSLVPATATLAASGAGSTVTSVLSVTTTAGTPVGSPTLKVAGTSSKVSGSVTAQLTVSHPLSASLSLSAVPASLTLAPGSAAAYAVQLVRTHLSGNVTFGMSGALPSGMTAAFSPSSSNGTSSTLRVTTTGAVPDGTYTLHLIASGNANKERQYAYASVQLLVKTTGRSLTISGNLNGLLAPGRVLPLRLSLTNPSNRSFSVTNLSVTLQSLSQTSYAISHGQTCSIGDYAVTQFGGGYPLVMPGSSTVTLSQLGVPAVQWPQIQFINRPVNQDGCKGATLSLSYSGSGQGG